MHSRDFEKIKRWYEKGIYTKQILKNLVIKGGISASEYEEITGERYED